MILILLIGVTAAVAQITPFPRDELTPAPKRNPHLQEFQRLDDNNDDKVSFTEFLLADRAYIEQQSRAFHKYDEDGDGVVSKDEFMGYYKKFDDDRRLHHDDRDRFFERVNPRDSSFESFPNFEHHPRQNFFPRYAAGSGERGSYNPAQQSNMDKNETVEEKEPKHQK